MTTLQEKLAAVKTEEKPATKVADKEVIFKSVNSRRGYQMPTRILRPNVMGVYTPADKAETEILEALVKQGFLIKE